MKVYVFDTNDLTEPLKRDDNVYSLPIFKKGSGMYGLNDVSVFVSDPILEGVHRPFCLIVNMKFGKSVYDVLKDLPIERCVFAIPQHHVTEECVRIFGCSYEMNYELKSTSLSMTFLVPFSHCYIFNSLSVFEDLCVKNSDSKTMFPSSDFVRCVVTKDGIFFKNEAIFDFYNKTKNYVPENYEDAIRKETILSLCQDVLCHISLVKNKSK